MHCCTIDIFIIWLKNNDQACLAPSLKVGLINEKELDNSNTILRTPPEGNGSLYMTQFCMGGHI